MTTTHSPMLPMLCILIPLLLVTVTGVISWKKINKKNPWWNSVFGMIAILVWKILEKQIMLRKQLSNTFNKHLAILNWYGFILHILLNHSNVRNRLNILIYVCFILFKNHFHKKILLNIYLGWLGKKVWRVCGHF